MRSLPLLQVAVGLACGASCVDGAQGRTVALGLVFMGLGVLARWEARRGV